MILSSYLPLLREVIPSAASEIESDLHASMSKQGSSLITIIHRHTCFLSSVTILVFGFKLISS